MRGGAASVALDARLQWRWSWAVAARRRVRAADAAVAVAVAAAFGSDMPLKHDIVLLGRLNDGLGYYRFVYNGGDTAYVGVMAQEVQTVLPEAVTRGVDGYMRVSYDRLGLPFEPMTSGWRTGAHLPSAMTARIEACCRLAPACATAGGSG